MSQLPTQSLAHSGPLSALPIAKSRVGTPGASSGRRVARFSRLTRRDTSRHNTAGTDITNAACHSRVFRPFTDTDNPLRTQRRLCIMLSTDDVTLIPSDVAAYL